ncbi:response regulator [Dehalogenimonas alkenigignens]|uniref:Response regulator receiver domain n=1 Tax=Dehalogenimonas alkenigignens TaxID=1217799 RepID=A0A0W0GIY1_9CHLR|nr:response regulator [Dehalogenimonas alkenigignens]KTB48521.1 Response regulator receiver domain [Dehalogenimonas alkenigignens]
MSEPQAKVPDQRRDIHVLLVEDEPAIGMACQRVLTGRGFKVTVAVDGQAAQSLLESNAYDICLLDIRTPQISGEELFKWIQVKRPELVPSVILTTGDVISGDTARFIQTSGRPSLPKPFAPNELLEIVTAVLGQLPYESGK